MYSISVIRPQSSLFFSFAQTFKNASKETKKPILGMADALMEELLSDRSKKSRDTDHDVGVQWRSSSGGGNKRPGRGKSVCVLVLIIGTGSCFLIVFKLSLCPSLHPVTTTVHLFIDKRLTDRGTVRVSS